MIHFCCFKWKTNKPMLMMCPSRCSVFFVNHSLQNEILHHQKYFAYSLSTFQSNQLANGWKNHTLSSRWCWKNYSNTLMWFHLLEPSVLVDFVWSHQSFSWTKSKYNILYITLHLLIKIIVCPEKELLQKHIIYFYNCFDIVFMVPN